MQIPGETYSRVSDAEFNRWANASALLLTLNRPQQSLDASNKALAIYPDAPWILYFRARAEVAAGDTQDAERDLLHSSALDDREYTWVLLLDLYRDQRRINEAVHVMEHMASRSSQPARILLEEGNFYLQSRRPQDALKAYDRAEEEQNSSTDKQTSAAIAHGHAAVWSFLGNMARATTYEEQAVQLEPNNASYWSQLAQLYTQQGRTREAEQAQQYAGASAAPR